jgi:hypothetical protein
VVLDRLQPLLHALDADAVGGDASFQDHGVEVCKTAGSSRGRSATVSRRVPGTIAFELIGLG